MDSFSASIPFFREASNSPSGSHRSKAALGGNGVDVRLRVLMALLLSATPDIATAQSERSPLPGRLESDLTDAVKVSPMTGRGSARTNRFAELRLPEEDNDSRTCANRLAMF